MVFRIDFAPIDCLIAHIIMSSGAIRAKIMRCIFRPKITHSPSPKNGIFGCTETQVHANVVAIQLYRMLSTVRVSGKEEPVSITPWLGEVARDPGRAVAHMKFFKNSASMRIESIYHSV